MFANVLGMLSTRSNFSWPTSCELIGQLKFERVETIQNMLEIMLANKKRWCQTKIWRKSSDIDPELFLPIFVWWDDALSAIYSKPLVMYIQLVGQLVVGGSEHAQILVGQSIHN